MLRFLILEYNGTSEKVRRNGLPLIALPSWPPAPPQPHHSELSPGVKPTGSEHWDSACLSAPGAALRMLCLPPLDCRKRRAWWRPTESFLMEQSLTRKGHPLETNPMSEAHTRLWLSRAPNAWVTADIPSACSVWAEHWPQGGARRYKNLIFSSLGRKGKMVSVLPWA